MNSKNRHQSSVERSTCEVCGNINLEPVLNLGNHPLCDDLVPIGDTRICDEYPIEILYCDRCITAHQRFQVPKRVLFPVSYHYRSRFTADVLSGMSALVEACEDKLGTSLKGMTVLDVGCNDGSLLDFFLKRGAKTIGIEPTNAYLDGIGKGHHLINGFFAPETASAIYSEHGSPDIITFTNVFAHIENLPELINALKLLITPKTLLVIENHYFGAVLERYQFDTFYHEHPRTYSLTSFLNIARSLGVSVSKVEFPSRYGGNIRVFLGGESVASAAEESLIQSVLVDEALFGERLRKMQDRIAVWKTQIKSRIDRLVTQHGKIFGKAFPGRAAILIKLLGIDTESLSAVYEKPGSMKIGHYLPGTRIPILSDDILFSAKIGTSVILNLAWHISEEINSYLRSNGYAGEIFDILTPKDISS